ncbi:MAG TPA: PEGA domain-containing protein, partial [Anaerolineae bacterium]|nr:PEGA domain-containing protein [Anaerolineae bacterium]
MGIPRVTCPQTKKNRSIGRQWVLLAVVALSSACRLTQPQASPTPAATPTLQPARAVITTSPAGAAVLVDGQPSGHTPLELTLAPSTHTIRVELAGYAPVERTVQLAPGQTIAFTETLRDTA